MTTLITCDVAIIGAGPAGAAAAIYAIKQGLKVVVLESENFPRHRPGETLHPGIEPLLEQLGVLEKIQQIDFIRHPGIVVNWDNRELFEPYGKGKAKQRSWLGYQAKRERFDQLLIEHAISLGGLVYFKKKVREVLKNASRVTGLVSDDLTVQASYVIDASGAHACLTRKLNLPQITYSKPLFVRYGYAKGRASTFDKAPKIQADQRGWTWIAKVDSDIYQWTRLVTDSVLPSQDWSPRKLHLLKPIGKSRGAETTWKKAKYFAGPGFFLTGDAAIILDPASSHGVLRAIMSAIRAADLIAQLMRRTCLEHLAVEAYQHWLEDAFREDVNKLSELYRHSVCGDILVATKGILEKPRSAL